MSSRTRTTVTAVATGFVLAFSGCAATADDPVVTSGTTAGSECAPTPPADTATPEGWIGYIAENPGSVALAIDDGTGRGVQHRTEDPQPLASAVKVVHLAAYAQAVADGRLDPAEPVPLPEWERWYLPDTDGYAHPRALERLGVSGPDATVTLDEMVSAMIRESDNAVPDYLRDRLGDDALRDAAAQGGWNDFTPPTMLGNTLAMFDPTLGDPDAAWEAARRYADDPGYREEVLTTSEVGDLFTDIDRIQRFGNAGSAAQLANLHRSLADGSFGPGSEIARGHLEWQPAPTGFEGVGFKGGSLPGVLTEALTFRRDDGTIVTAVLLAADMTEDEYSAAFEALPHQQLVIAAANDPETLERIRCAT